MNMKLFILTILFCLQLHADEERKLTLNERNKKIESLLERELAAINKVTNKGDKLSYRLIELYAEKLKIYRERENTSFLNADIKERKSKVKSQYFNSSADLYGKLLFLGDEFSNKFNRSVYYPHVLYTLGIASRDYSQDKKSEKFFRDGLKLADQNKKQYSELVYKFNVGLAEYYYNEKKYEQSIEHYSIVLINKNEHWYTKHLFNSGWCYFKEKSFDKSIELLQESFFLSKKKNYANMSEQVANTLGLFFVFADRIPEGFSFYKNNLEAPMPYLIKMILKAASQSGKDKTFKLIEDTRELGLQKNDFESLYELTSHELDIYRQFSDGEEYFKAVKRFADWHVKFPLKNDVKNEIVEKIRDFVSFNQSKLVKSFRESDQHYDRTLYKRVQDYFAILQKVDSERDFNYLYFSGETDFALMNYQLSARTYRVAYEKADIKATLEFKKKILVSLIANIPLAKFSKDIMSDFKFFSFTNYLHYWPKDLESREYFKELFLIVFERKEWSISVGIIENYHTYFNQDLEFQQAMMAKVVDFFIVQKMSQELAYQLLKLNQGYLKFGKEYLLKVEVALGEILFEEYRNLDKAGKKEVALVGLINLYQNKIYPDKVRADLSYTASTVLLELVRVEESGKWLEESWGLFTIEQLREKETLFFNVIGHYSKLGEQKLALDLEDKLAKKIELKEKDNWGLLRFYNLMALGMFENAKTHYQKLKQEKIIKDSILLEMENELILTFINEKVIAGAVELIQNSANPTNYKEELHSILFTLSQSSNDFSTLVSYMLSKKMLEDDEKKISRWLERNQSPIARKCELKNEELVTAFNQLIECEIKEAKKITESYQEQLKAKDGFWAYLAANDLGDYYQKSYDSLKGHFEAVAKANAEEKEYLSQVEAVLTKIALKSQEFGVTKSKYQEQVVSLALVTDGADVTFAGKELANLIDRP